MLRAFKELLDKDVADESYTGITWNRCKFDCTVRNCTFTECVFDACNFTGAVFDHCTFEHCTIMDSRGLGRGTFDRCTLRKFTYDFTYGQAPLFRNCMTEDFNEMDTLPSVPRLLERIRESIGSECEHLDMNEWECGATKCLAGWACHLAGVDGEEYGFRYAGTLIFANSIGRIPDFYMNKEDAVRFIETGEFPADVL